MKPLFIFFAVNDSSGQREVQMLQPFTRKDLMIRSLPDRINDCEQVRNRFRELVLGYDFGNQLRIIFFVSVRCVSHLCSAYVWGFYVKKLLKVY